METISDKRRKKAIKMFKERKPIWKSNNPLKQFIHNVKCVPYEALFFRLSMQMAAKMRKKA